MGGGSGRAGDRVGKGSSGGCERRIGNERGEEHRGGEGSGVEGMQG